MKNSTKIILAILVFFFLVLFIIVLALSKVEKQQPQEVIYPASSLTQSIFDSQNMVYQNVEELPKEMGFDTIPYTLHVADVPKATVGNGSIYRIDDMSYIYISTFDNTETTASNVIKSELSKALLIDAIDDSCVVQNMAQETGYINGFGAKYYVDVLTASNGFSNAKAYMVVYELFVPNEEYQTQSILICTAATVESTQAYEFCKSYCDAIISTCQFNEEKHYQIQDAIRAQQDRDMAEDEAQNEQEVSYTNSYEEESEYDDYDPYEEESVDDTERDEEVEKFKEMAVSLNEDYDSLVLYFYWTNSAETLDLTLYTPDKSASYRPSSNSGGTAVFNLGKVSAGKWILDIVGDYGECSMKLQNTSAASETEPPNEYSNSNGVAPEADATTDSDGTELPE